MKYPRICLLIFWVGLSTAVQAQPPTKALTLDQAVAIATADDPWLVRSRHEQAAMADEAVAAGTLPDPRISLTGINLPLDSFDINQEAMTQLAVGISQTLPRGDSLALARQQKQQLAQQQPLLRVDRKAKVAQAVTRLWLSAYEAQESVRLIEGDRNLFEQLVDVAQAGYATALAGTSQQYLIRAQLELTRLEDRLTVLRQQQDESLQRLGEWISGAGLGRVGPDLPRLRPRVPVSGLERESVTAQARYEWVSGHPALLALEKQIDALETRVELARQKYRPEWGLNARYGFRDEDLNGRGRADFLTLGVTFDVPLFTANRQDREVSAARSRLAALKTQRRLLARQLTAQLKTAVVELNRLDQRQAIYEGQLLSQIEEQAEAALAAYNNDAGDFAEAVRARIDYLNAQLQALGIAVARQKAIARINYLLTDASD